MTLTTDRALDNTRQTSEIKIFDLQGNLIASQQGSGAGALIFILWVKQFAGNGTISNCNLPNAFSADNPQAKDRYTRTSVINFRGLLKRSSDCDRGAQHYIRDRAGWLRFRLDASGAAVDPNRFVLLEI